uniref:MICOS complex subunit n=1 Tax=Xenopus tropicalis TaxID=8364 RepID=A0A803JPC9_XENTR
MFKVVRLVSVPASLGFVSLHIHAATEDSTSPRKIIKVEELSLYSTPVQEAKYVEDKQTQLEEGVSWVRQAVAPYTSWCQDAYIKAKPKFETAVEHSKGTYEFLKDAPPGFYPRLGLIGFAGIVGLFLARGSRVKKVIYPLGFMGLGASLYYPQQAVTIAKLLRLQVLKITATNCQTWKRTVMCYIISEPGVSVVNKNVLENIDDC